MYVLLGVMVDPGLAEERHEEQTEHVEGRHSRHASAEQPQQDVPSTTRKRPPQNFILREEASQSRRSGNGKRPEKHGPERNRDFVFQRSHFAHVLFMMHRMNYAARAKEQERFEEGMRHQMEDAGGKCTDSERKKHVAKLADRRVRKDAFNIV